MSDDFAWEGNFLDEEEEQEEQLFAPEPLFTALLRRALGARCEDDPVLRDMVAHFCGSLPTTSTPPDSLQLPAVPTHRQTWRIGTL